MADSVAKSLNDLFSSSLSARDKANLQSVVEDYFCFNSDDEDRDSGKCIHCYYYHYYQ